MVTQNTTYKILKYLKFILENSLFKQFLKKIFSIKIGQNFFNSKIVFYFKNRKLFSKTNLNGIYIPSQNGLFN